MKEIRIAVRTYSNALSRLEEGLSKSSDDELYRDGVIQRFEFTFEQFWKTLRRVLKHEGFECRSPRSCIKEAFKNGYLKEGEVFLDMLDDRNRSSHIYNEETSIEIYKRISNEYYAPFKEVLTTFQKYLEEADLPG